MRALIDGDILCYSIGSAKDEDTGEPLSWPLTLARLDGFIHKIVREVGATEYTVYLTGKGNFRKEEATIKPYKGNRNADKPHHYKNIRDYFKGTKNHDVVWAEGYEADDAMSIEQWDDLNWAWKDGDSPDACGTIICSLDKDLDMVPGMHYKWSRDGKEGKKYFVSEMEGLHSFYKQLLMGDPTDNIPGLYNIGPSKADRLLAGIKSELDMYEVVKGKYQDYFGSYWRMFMHENARLLWMLREEEDDIRVRLDDEEKLIGNTEF